MAVMAEDVKDNNGGAGAGMTSGWAYDVDNIESHDNDMNYSIH